MQFRFSYVGLIYLVMLMLPNIVWTRNRPRDHEKYVGSENRVLLALERISEILVSCVVLIFSDFNPRLWSGWSWWLAASFLLMVLYEVYWIRYFKSEKTMQVFYSSLFGIRSPERRSLSRHFCCWPYTERTQRWEPPF